MLGQTNFHHRYSLPPLLQRSEINCSHGIRLAMAALPCTYVLKTIVR